ncbi:MAG: hypothetical protein IAE90_11250 [Ignavibacteria bacterium]|nr:hypothetical protein [Ignavibacteria bacterium]
MKKIFCTSLLFIFVIFQFSCEINVSDGDGDGNGNQSFLEINSPQPFDGETNIQCLTSLSWNINSQNVNSVVYQIFLDTLNPPLNFIDETNYLSYFISNPLLSNKIYYWKIRARYDSGESISSIWRFRTAQGLPPAPVNLLPQNGASGIVLRPQLSWLCDAPDLTFDVYLDVLYPPENIVAFNLYTTNHTVFSSLQGNTTYYWKIKAKNYLGETEGSIWSFTTKEEY